MFPYLQSARLIESQVHDHQISITDLKEGFRILRQTTLFLPLRHPISIR
jgi:hypothetical protein